VVLPIGEMTFEGDLKSLKNVVQYITYWVTVDMLSWLRHCLELFPTYGDLLAENCTLLCPTFM